MLERFAILEKPRVEYKRPEPLLDKADTRPDVILDADYKTITMANVSLNTRSYFTVHNLEDYRRGDSSILLIPNTFITFDSLLFDREELLKCTLTL